MLQHRLPCHCRCRRCTWRTLLLLLPLLLLLLLVLLVLLLLLLLLLLLHLLLPLRCRCAGLGGSPSASRLAVGACLLRRPCVPLLLLPALRLLWLGGCGLCLLSRAAVGLGRGTARVGRSVCPAFCRGVLRLCLGRLLLLLLLVWLLLRRRSRSASARLGGTGARPLPLAQHLLLLVGLLRLLLLRLEAGLGCVGRGQAGRDGARGLARHRARGAHRHAGAQQPRAAFSSWPPPSSLRAP
jgi:hypothetical protein